MEPSNKTPEMEKTLQDLFGFDRRKSIRAATCVPAPIGCGGPAVEFKDECSRHEFTISGLCQRCQDSFFG